MSRALAVLRPEPGNAATAQRIEARGFRAVRLPLFAIGALDRALPAPADHDALILTSGNTVRYGRLDGLTSLPVLAVGEATASAARAAGFHVVLTGDRDAAHLLALAGARGFTRALHLGGRERTMPPSAIITASIAVYASDPIPIDDLSMLSGAVALLHSTRAASRLGSLVTDRAAVRIAAISPAVLAAAGPGWQASASAASPDDDALITAAIALAD